MIAATLIARSRSQLQSIPVVLDRAGLLEVVEQDRFHVEVEVDLVADHDSAPGDLVLPRDAKVVPVDPGARLKADAAQIALVLVADPERRLPFAEIVDVERHGLPNPADSQVDVALERLAAGP